jgi:hypothetical protein
VREIRIYRPVEWESLWIGVERMIGLRCVVDWGSGKTSDEFVDPTDSLWATKFVSSSKGTENQS